MLADELAGGQIEDLTAFDGGVETPVNSQLLCPPACGVIPLPEAACSCRW